MSIEEQLLDDTDIGVQEQLYDFLRGLSPEERLARMNALCAFGFEMMLSGIRSQFPGCSSTEERQKLAARLWGNDFVKKYLSGGSDNASR